MEEVSAALPEFVKKRHSARTSERRTSRPVPTEPYIPPLQRRHVRRLRQRSKETQTLISGPRRAHDYARTRTPRKTRRTAPEPSRRSLQRQFIKTRSPWQIQPTVDRGGTLSAHYRCVGIRKDSVNMTCTFSNSIFH